MYDDQLPNSNKQATCESIWLQFTSPGSLVIRRCEPKWTEKKNATQDTLVCEYVSEHRKQITKVLAPVKMRAL